MESNPNGDGKSSKGSLKNKIKELNKLLDEFENHIGIPDAPNRGDEIAEYLSWTRTEIQGLTHEQAAEIHLEISLHLFHLNKKISRSRAAIKFLEGQLQEALGKYGAEYSGFYEKGEKLARIIEGDEYYKEVNRYLKEYEQRVTNIYSVVDSVKIILESMKQIQFAKKVHVNPNTF